LFRSEIPLAFTVDVGEMAVHVAFALAGYNNPIDANIVDEPPRIRGSVSTDKKVPFKLDQVLLLQTPQC
jgi:hypothetical protein